MQRERWVCPHNPVVSPLEGLCLARAMYSYFHDGKRCHPSAVDLRTATVDSAVGSFFVCDPIGPGALQIHREVPASLKSFVRTLLRENAVAPIPHLEGFRTLPVANTPAKGGNEQLSALVLPPAVVLEAGATGPSYDDMSFPERVRHLSDAVDKMVEKFPEEAAGPEVKLATEEQPPSVQGAKVAPKLSDEEGFRPKLGEPPKRENGSN